MPDELRAVGFSRDMQRALEADAERLRAEGVDVEVTFVAPHEHTCNRPEDASGHSTCRCDCGATCYNTMSEPDWTEPS